MDGVHPLLRLPVEIRTILYSTDLVESITFQLRRITKTRGNFPTDDAALKLIRFGVSKSAAWRTLRRLRNHIAWHAAAASNGQQAQ